MTDLLEKVTVPFGWMRPPRRSKPLIVRKNKATGNWVWRCGSKREKDCFGRWGTYDNQIQALREALSHFETWHVGGKI